jgi:3-oxoacyl-[acyl-carrier-protein] synthase-1
LDDSFMAALLARLRDASRSRGHARVFVSGSLGAVEGLLWAEHLLASQVVPYAMVLGVDTYLHAPTLAALYDKRRILTAKNGDGFLPGEAAAAVLLGPRTNEPGAFQCLGLAWGREPALQESDIPLRGDGLAQAYRGALQAAGLGFESIDYRLTDIAGDQYAFKDAALALLRTMRVKKEEMDLWHPADCIGRVGAATAPLLLGVAHAAARRRYAPGPGVLCHVAEDNGLRAALVLREYLSPHGSS